MKLKITTIHKREDGSYSLSDYGNTTPVNAWFLHTFCKPDEGALYFSNKPMKSTRNETRIQFFAVPKPGASDADKAKAEQAIKRGMTFFSRREGLLFGAITELYQVAEVIRIETY